MIKHVFLITMLFPAFACANVMWPSLFVADKTIAWQVIIASILIEIICYKWILNEIRIFKVIIYTIIANALSALFGLFLIPFGGIVYELTIGMILNWAFNVNTFDLIAWIFVPIVAGSINSIVELYTIRVLSDKLVTRRTYMWGWVVNALTISIPTVWTAIDMKYNANNYM